jgi:sugar/nucleoside kinase (ribokinase family)
MVYDKIDGSRNLVVGVGSALIDILAHEEEAFLATLGAVKGGMTYADQHIIDDFMASASPKPAVVPGGSACNTMVGISQLGGQARFIGKCGSGRMGNFFRTDLARQNVDAMLFASDSPTGRVLSIITPDTQRSMLTYLGASAEIRPEEISSACFKDAAIVHLEGYLLFNRDLFEACMEAAQQAGALISLDLASFNIVQGAKNALQDDVQKYVDILISNEDEALAYTGIQSETEALCALSEHVDIAVLKVGARGSMVSHLGRQVQIRPYGDGSAVDTTGAGDLWASGFLHGMVNQMPLDLCGVLASRCGHAVCQVVGTKIQHEQWEIIRKFMEEKWPKRE